MKYYNRVLPAINTALPCLLPTQAANLALLVSAILIKQSLCLTELARAIPTPQQRRVQAPKHDLLHRLKRLWRFVDNKRVVPQAVQLALIPYTLSSLGRPRLLGLAIDWTMWDTLTPKGERVRYQVLRIAVPRRGRALPLLQLAYYRDNLPADSSQNQLEEEVLLAVIRSLPAGVRAVILADRGFGRTEFIRWLQAHKLEYVIRVKRGTCITEPDGRRWKLGEQQLKPGEYAYSRGVHYALHNGRPTDVVVHLALCWKVSKSRLRREHKRQRNQHKEPKEPWYLVTSLSSAQSAAARLWQRGWIEQSFKDSKSRFGLKYVKVAARERLNRLLMGLTLALSWLTLLALPHIRALPADYASSVVAWGRASLITLALQLLETLGDLSPLCLPQPLSNP